MTKTIAIRRISVAVFVALCISKVLAQGAISAQGASAADAAAYSKLNAGQVDAAAAAFQAVLATQPNDAGALAGMGQVRILQGNYLGAVSFLEQAKQASPNDPTIAAALDGARYHFLMSEGHDAQSAKDAVDAEKRYREALELRPADSDAVNALVNVLVVENKLTDAQDVLSTAVAQAASVSGHPPVDLEMQLAQMDIASGQPQLAYPIFLQVLQESPDRVDAWSGLISTLHLMRHDADAIAQERAIPADTRAQLEATPGFQQMMAGMASAPASPPMAEQSYTPFVPSAVPAPVPPAIATSPAPVTLVPPVSAPRPATPPMGSLSAKPSAPRLAGAATTRPAMPVSSQTPPSVAAQTAPASQPAKSSGSGAPLVTQPAARPAAHSETVPDTGEQQYPQPKTRPRGTN